MISYIIVNDVEQPCNGQRGMILCYDRKWRHHAPLGCGSTCMKFYQKYAAALKCASKIKGAKVVEVPHGYTVDAAGNIQPPE